MNRSKTPLNYLSAARFQGAEAGEFLQNQLSADIAALKPGDACFAAYCSPKGKVLGLLLVGKGEDDYLVAAAADLLPGILDRLRIFVMRTRVEFSLEPGLRLYGVEPSSDPAAGGYFQPDDLPLYYLFSGQPADEPGGAFKAKELRCGISWLNADTAEKFIPQMLGHDQIGAVSFSKGCYPGQEIVARARYLGKVKRKPVVVQVEGNLATRPSEAVEICRGDSWDRGTVIDSVTLGSGDTLVLIVAPAEPDSTISSLRHGDRVYRCATI
jgi:hypothetical protein